MYIGLRRKAYNVSHKIFMSLNFKTLMENVTVSDVTTTVQSSVHVHGHVSSGFRNTLDTQLLAVIFCGIVYNAQNSS